MTKSQVVKEVESWVIAELRKQKLDTGNVHRTDLKNEISEFLDSIKENHASGLDEHTEIED